MTQGELFDDIQRRPKVGELQAAHDEVRSAITSWFVQHGRFPSEAEVSIDLLWKVVDWFVERRIPVQFVPNNLGKYIIAFYGVKLVPAQDLSLVDSLLKVRCIG